MKVKKGDIVQMLSGKDRGKQGRVLDARPRDGKVLVENLNVARRHTKPKPMRDRAAWAGRDDPRRDPRARRRRLGQQRDGRLPDLQAADPRRLQTKELKGETIKVRVCKREGCGQEIDR